MKAMVKTSHKYEILDKKCLSSNHTAYIAGVIHGSCQCPNCKIWVRNHRYHKGAYGGDTSYHDYVYDAEEVQEISSKGLIMKIASDEE